MIQKKNLVVKHKEESKSNDGVDPKTKPEKIKFKKMKIIRVQLRKVI